jgi:hypothetical protein
MIHQPRPTKAYETNEDQSKQRTKQQGLMNKKAVIYCD